MGADATIFSISETIQWALPLTPAMISTELSGALQRLGNAFSYKKIIVGHIKVLAVSIDEPQRFLFLSATRVDRVDQKASEEWTVRHDNVINNLRLDVNVLVFGHTRKAIEEKVAQELEQLRNLVAGCR